MISQTRYSQAPIEALDSGIASLFIKMREVEFRPLSHCQLVDYFTDKSALIFALIVHV